MPGGEAAVSNPSLKLTESDGTTPAVDATTFEETWREILVEARDSNLKTDLEERHSPATFERVLPLAAANPDRVSITREPMGRRRDMIEHVRDDIETLLDKDHFVHRFVKPAPETEAILKFFELGYLYDSVARFCSEIVVATDTDGLEDLRFLELSNELEEWMGRVDVLWQMAGGDIPSPDDRAIEDLIDDLYAERVDFIEVAREMDMFLPITPPGGEADDSSRIADRIETGLRRNGTVSADLVFEYCYSRTTDY